MGVAAVMGAATAVTTGLALAQWILVNPKIDRKVEHLEIWGKYRSISSILSWKHFSFFFWEGYHTLNYALPRDLANNNADVTIKNWDLTSYWHNFQNFLQILVGPGSATKFNK